MVQQALELAYAHSPLIIAADGGARVAQHFGLSIDYVIGDLDSLDTMEIATLEKQGSKIQQFPFEKNETDLELALHLARKQTANWIRIIGGVGDRIDQTLGNLYLLALPILDGCDIRLAAGKQEAWLLHPGTHLIEGTAGDTISLIPLGGTVYGIRTEQLYYPLRDEILMFGPARGMSNVMTADTAHVFIEKGVLLVVHTVGRA